LLGFHDFPSTSRDEPAEDEADGERRKGRGHRLLFGESDEAMVRPSDLLAHVANSFLDSHHRFSTASGAYLVHRA
jgi:hypothetical protein